MEIQSRRAQVAELLAALQAGLLEREEAMSLALLAALAGESIFLLGRPGVAKSLIARRLKYAFADGQAFEYLMNRFSTPDEVFGPVSISKLKDQDRYERIVEHYLPAAEVVFLDEIWKAGPAIQNSLLTALNEKKFRNGAQEIDLPMKVLIAASNELPAEGEGLEALWDRFLLRYVVEPIQEKKNFNALLLDTADPTQDNIHKNLKITTEAYKNWLKSAQKITIPPHILATIHDVRQEIENYNQNNAKTPVFKPLYVSDRRWKKIAKILKTAAFFHDKNEISAAECFLLPQLLWDAPEQLETIADIVYKSIEKYALQADFAGLKSSIDELEALVKRETTTIVEKKVPKLHEGRYYELSGSSQHRYILKHEFDNLSFLSDTQQMELQTWQSHPRQNFPHGYMAARRHPINPESQLLEVSRYGSTHVHNIVTELQTNQITQAPTETQRKEWDYIASKLAQCLQEATQQLQKYATNTEKLLFTQPKAQEALQHFAQNALPPLRTLLVRLEKLQYQYQNIK